MLRMEVYFFIYMNLRRLIKSVSVRGGLEIRVPSEKKSWASFAERLEQVLDFKTYVIVLSNPLSILFYVKFLFRNTNFY